MSYIEEINRFWELQEINQLSTGQVALWFALMHINNRAAWQDWFTVASSKLVSLTGLSRAGVYKARNALKQKGYIDYKEAGSRTQSASYALLPLSESRQDGRQASRQAGRQDGRQASRQASRPINRLKTETKTETKKRDANASPKEMDVFAVFAGDDMALLTALQDFAQMRKTIKKPLTERAQQMLIHRLQSLSADKRDWIAMLEESVLHCWHGVFPLKDNESTQQGRHGDHSLTWTEIAEQMEAKMNDSA